MKTLNEIIEEKVSKLDNTFNWESIFPKNSKSQQAMRDFLHQALLDIAHATVEVTRVEKSIDNKTGMCWKCSYFGKDCKCDFNAALSKAEQKEKEWFS